MIVSKFVLNRSLIKSVRLSCVNLNDQLTAKKRNIETLCLKLPLH